MLPDCLQACMAYTNTVWQTLSCCVAQQKGWKDTTGKYSILFDATAVDGTHSYTVAAAAPVLHHILPNVGRVAPLPPTVPLPLPFPLLISFACSVSLTCYSACCMNVWAVATFDCTCEFHEDKHNVILRPSARN